MASELGQQLEQMVSRARRLRDGSWEEQVRDIEEFGRVEPPAAGSYSPVKMSLTSQYNREIGSRLYNRNPTVRVQTEPWASQAHSLRAPIEENLLNLAMERTGFFTAFRDCITDSFSAYGVLWHGLDRDDPRLPSVEWVRWSDVWVDPDVRRMRDKAYIVRRCRTSKAQMIKTYATNDDGSIDRKKANKIMEARHGSTSDSEDKDRDGYSFSEQSVVYYKIYTKTGLAFFEEGVSKVPDQDQLTMAKCYVVLDGSWDVIYDGPWETPYFITGGWPCSILSYYNSREFVYPDPPLQDGIPWMKAINSAMNDLNAQYDWMSRMFIVLLKGAGLEVEAPDLDKLRSVAGAPVQFMEYELSSALGPQALKNADIRRFMHVLDLGDDRYGQKLAHIQQLKDEWYRSVGLNEYMYFGSAEKQDRSARATQAREQNAMSRVNDMRSVIDEFASEVLRKMLFTARIHDTEEDIAALMGEQAGQLWGSSLSAEQSDPAYWEDYYRQNPGEMAPDTSPVDMAQATVAGGVDIKRWLDSTDVKIELGSTARKSPEQEEESIAQANNQLVPSLNNMGMPLAAAMFVGKRAELLGMTADQVGTIMQSGMSSQQLINMQKQLEIASLQAQLQNLQAQQQQQAQAQQAQQEQQAMAQAEQEHRMQMDDTFRSRELDAKEVEAMAKAVQAMRPTDMEKE